MRMQASLTCSVFHSEGMSPMCMGLHNVLSAEWALCCFLRNTAVMLISTELGQSSYRQPLDVACTHPLLGLLYQLPATRAANSLISSPIQSCISQKHLPLTCYVSLLLFLYWLPFHTIPLFILVFVLLLKSAFHSYFPFLSVEAVGECCLSSRQSPVEEKLTFSLKHSLLFPTFF